MNRPRLLQGLWVFLGLLPWVMVGVLLLQQPALVRLEGQAAAITDGDTFTLATGAQRLKIRLSAIDTPEVSQPYGEQAKQALTAWVAGRVVRVDVAGLDKYGRTLGRVCVQDLGFWWGLVCRDINARLVEQGFAWVYRQYNHDPRLVELETEARAARRGLWGLPADQRIPPWEFRQAGRSRSMTPLSDAQRQAGCQPDKRFCRDMTTCEEAKFYLTTCGLGKLDRDGDGVPCEKLCR